MFMRKNVIPRTIIFPRNNIAHLDLFHQFGFTCYRGEELVPKYYRMPLLGRVFRRSHYYLSAVTVPIVYDYKYDPSGLVNLPSSRWFFGFNQRVERYLDALNLHLLRIHKMVKGVEKAAAEKKVIHIWTHPCEFKTEKDFDKLRYLFEAVSKQITRGSIQSVGMADLARKVFASGISNRQ